MNIMHIHGCRSVTDTYSSGGDDLFIHPPLMNRYYVIIDTHVHIVPFAEVIYIQIKDKEFLIFSVCLIHIIIKFHHT